MPMLAIFPDHYWKRSGMCRKSGYSLMELLVVLSLVSLISALAMPNLVTLYRNFSNTLALDEIARQINGIGYRAHLARQSYWLESIAATDIATNATSINESVNADFGSNAIAIGLDLPEGWSLDVIKPVRYSANGACAGGALNIYFQGTLRHSTNLNPPYCQVQ